MKIKDVISEAISLTKYSTPTYNKILDAIKDCVLLDADQSLKVSKYSYVHSPRDKLLDNVHETDSFMSVVSFIPIYKDAILKEMNNKIAGMLYKLGNEIVPNNKLQSVQIKPLSGSTSGSVSGFNMLITDKYTTMIASAIEDQINTIIPKDLLYDSIYKAEDNFFQLVKDKIIPWVPESIHITIANRHFTDTFIHELVHVVQHSAEDNNGRTTTNYSSYLSKNKRGKNEFLNLMATDNESARYRKLYYASPQEMSAFSHNIVQDLVRSYDDIMPALPSLEQDIVYAIKEYIDPDTPAERKVFNRYVKLVYQEMMRYFDALQ